MVLRNLQESKSRFLTQENKRSFSGIVLLGSQRVFQKSFGLISTYFLVRALTQDEFGMYSFVIGVVSTMTIFGFGGLKNAIMQSVARGHRGTYRKAVPLSFSGCLLGSFVMLGLAFFYHKTGQAELSTALMIAACLLPFYEGFSQWRNIRIGEEKFSAFFKQETFWQFTMHSTMVAVALLYPHNTALPVLVFLGVPALLNTLFTLRDFRSIAPEETDEPESIAYGLRTSFYAAFNTVAVNADKLFLFAFLSPSATAIFVAAERIPEVLRNVVQDAIAVYAPRFAREETYTKNLDDLLKKAALVIGLAVFVFAFTLLPWILIFVFGETYSESVIYAQILCLSVAIGNASNIRFRYIRSKLDTTNFAKITIVTSVLRIAMSALLIPVYGIAGAVASAFAYRVIMTLTVDWVIRTHYLKAVK
ncbi:MAG: oligosaccharide flippase family protein [Alphaproteobacteria bacterium]|jgi:O-antigen/teichoic acid export membrane protein|nr:oligosaccharide flippase family protein [Alphaproteobacteria bacterium]QQS58120.1 MAG: oligosaccharide flippase family protein [Alphaproteobacteria bacterium]